MKVFVTGASGYLGQHLVALGGIPLARGDYEPAAGQVVIHAAWGVPKTEAQLDDPELFHTSLVTTELLIAAKPSFVVLVGTRLGGGAYATGKRLAYARITEAGIPCHHLRLPPLFGPPRRAGLVYTALTTILAGQPFTPDRPLPDWTAMPVAMAARQCWDAAHRREPGQTDATCPALEELLTWVRSSS